MFAQLYHNYFRFVPTGGHWKGNGNDSFKWSHPWSSKLQFLDVFWNIIYYEFESFLSDTLSVLMNYMLSSRCCRLNGQIHRKTYGPGETRTHNNAFRRNLVNYYWATGLYWTSRLRCHMVELKVSSPLIHYCQLRVIQLNRLLLC